MKSKIIRLGPKEDLSLIVKKLRASKEREVVLMVEAGAVILSDDTGLNLIKKTAEVLGKRVFFETDDPFTKKILAHAGLHGQGEQTTKIRHNIVLKRFSYIVAPQTGGLLPKVESKPLQNARGPKPAATKTYKSQFAPVKFKEGFGFLSFLKRRLKWLVFLGVVLLVLMLLLAYVLPSATITVYARSEPVTRDMEITIDKNVTTVDETRLVIPGILISKEISKTQSFPTTGNNPVGTKASGSVTIYNFTKNTLTLKSSTTTLVASGKKYFFTKDATGIRPTITNGSQVDPASLTAPIAIVAEQAGVDYNLAANIKFQIINKALGNKPEVYAINAQAILGGQAQAKPVLSQADLDKAIGQLSLSLASPQALNLPQGTAVLSSAVKEEVLAKTANKNVGQEAENFDLTLIVRITALTYRQDDVKDLILDKIKAVLSDDKYLLPNANEQISARFKTNDLAAGNGVLAVHFETVAAYKVDESNLSKILAGKTASEIKEILLTKPEIDRVDVEFSPFYVHSAPTFNGKVKVKTVLSQS